MSQNLSESEILNFWHDKSWKGSFTGVKNFQLLLKTDKNIDISQNEILKALRKDPLYLKHLKPHRKIERRSYNLSYYGELLQSDLAYMFTYGDYKYFIVLIDCFSLKVYTAPLKTKTAKEVFENFLILFKKFNCEVKKIQTDQGTEFDLCKKFCKENNILFSYKFGANKSNFAEWIIMVLKRRLYKILRDNRDLNWPSQLVIVTEQFNDTPQKKIGFLKPKLISSFLDTVKVTNALKSLNLPLKHLTSFEEQKKNQQNYLSNSKNLQVDDYVYLDFNQSIFGKSFDIQVKNKKERQFFFNQLVLFSYNF